MSPTQLIKHLYTVSSYYFLYKMNLSHLNSIPSNPTQPKYIYMLNISDRLHLLLIWSETNFQEIYFILILSEFPWNWNLPSHEGADTFVCFLSLARSTDVEKITPLFVFVILLTPSGSGRDVERTYVIKQD